jgi:hypothetical protein
LGLTETGHNPVLNLLEGRSPYGRSEVLDRR